MRVKGRYLILAWTAVFLSAVGVIVWRDGAAFPARHELEDLDRQIRELDAIRATLEARISALSSRDSLTPKAIGLGLRQASDTELVQLSVSRGP